MGWVVAAEKVILLRCRCNAIGSQFGTVSTLNENHFHLSIKRKNHEEKKRETVNQTTAKKKSNVNIKERKENGGEIYSFVALVKCVCV